MQMSGRRPGFTLFAMAGMLGFFVANLSSSLFTQSAPQKTLFAVAPAISTAPSIPAEEDAAATGDPVVALGIAQETGFAAGRDVLHNVELRMTGFSTCLGPTAEMSPSGSTATAHLVVEDGRVTRATLGESSIAPASVGRCMVGVMESWTFQPGDRGELTLRLLIEPPNTFPEEP